MTTILSFFLSFWLFILFFLNVSVVRVFSIDNTVSTSNASSITGESKESSDKLHNKTKFLMYSSLTDTFVDYLSNYTKAKTFYAQKYGYQYVDKSVDLNINHYVCHKCRNDIPQRAYGCSLRIYAGINIMLANNTHGITGNNDWLVYFDGDASFGELDSPLDAMLDIAQHFGKITNDKTPCQFIAQDGGHGINSGFWMIKNSSWGLQFLYDWRDDYENSDDFSWTFDQGPLMNTVLHYTAAYTKNKYSNECKQQPTGHKSNVCYADTMIKFGYVKNSRKIGPICLLPQDMGLPYRFHSHGSNRYHGEMVWHQKDLTLHQLLNSSIFHYDSVNRLFYPKNGVLVKSSNYKSRSIYLVVNGTRRQFSGWNQFVSMKFDLADVIPINDYYLQLIPEINISV